MRRAARDRYSCCLVRDLIYDTLDSIHYAFPMLVSAQHLDNLVQETQGPAAREVVSEATASAKFLQDKLTLHFKPSRTKSKFTASTMKVARLAETAYRKAGVKLVLAASPASMSGSP